MCIPKGLEEIRFDVAYTSWLFIFSFARAFCICFVFLDTIDRCRIVVLVFFAILQLHNMRLKTCFKYFSNVFACLSICSHDVNKAMEGLSNEFMNPCVARPDGLLFKRVDILFRR